MVKRSIPIQTLAHFKIKIAFVIEISPYPSKNGNYQCNYHNLIHWLMKFQLYTCFNNGYSFQEGNFDRFIQSTTTA